MSHERRHQSRPAVARVTTSQAQSTRIASWTSVSARSPVFKQRPLPRSKKEAIDLMMAQPNLIRPADSRARVEGGVRLRQGPVFETLTMAERIYYTDPYAQAVRRHGGLGVHEGRPAGRRPRSDGVLSDVRRPAVRHRHDQRRSRHQVEEDDAGEILHVLDRAVEPGPVRARSTGIAVSTTCSSTPASTCCRPPSIACAARRPSAFTSAPSAARSIFEGAAAGRDRGRRARGESCGVGGSSGVDPIRACRRGGVDGLAEAEPP